MAVETTKIPVGIYCGLDHYSIGFYDHGPMECNLIILDRNTENQYQIPCYIAPWKRGNDEEIEYIFGAASQGAVKQQFCLYGWGRLMGKTFEEYQTMEKDDFTFQVEEDEYGMCKLVIPNPFDETQSLKFSPEELAAMMLRHIIDIIKRVLGVGTKYVLGEIVATLPDHYTRSQRAAMERAFQLAEIPIYKFIEESCGVVVGYNRFMNYQMGQPEKVLGKGDKVIVVGMESELEVSCCQNGDPVKVISTSRNPSLKEQSFDDVVGAISMDILEEDPDAYEILIREEGNDRLKYRLKREYKLMKDALIEHDCANFRLNNVLPSHFDDPCDSGNVVVPRSEFEDKCVEKGLIAKLEQCIKRVLRESMSTPSDIKAVILIGKCCDIPIIRRTIESIFPSQIIVQDEYFDTSSASCEGAILTSLYSTE